MHRGVFPHLKDSVRAAIEKSKLNSSLIQGVHAASAVMIALEAFRAGRVGAQCVQAAIGVAARSRVGVEAELEERASAWIRAAGGEVRTTIKGWLRETLGLRKSTKTQVYVLGRLHRAGRLATKAVLRLHNGVIPHPEAVLRLRPDV